MGSWNILSITRTVISLVIPIIFNRNKQTINYLSDQSVAKCFLTSVFPSTIFPLRWTVKCFSQIDPVVGRWNDLSNVSCTDSCHWWRRLLNGYYVTHYIHEMFQLLQSVTAHVCIITGSGNIHPDLTMYPHSISNIWLGKMSGIKRMLDLRTSLY